MTDQEKKTLQEQRAKERASFEETIKDLSPEEKTAKLTEWDAQHPDKTKDTDYDAEIEKEKALGKRDGATAFIDRTIKRNATGEEIVTPVEEEDDDNAPATKGDLKRIARITTAQNLETQALALARNLTTGVHENPDKAAQLIIAKWKNRSFPTDMPLQEQIEEMNIVTFKDKITGTAAEAARAARGKTSVVRDGAGSHQGDRPADEPTGEDATAIKAAGFVWNGAARRWQKTMKDGSTLIRQGGKTLRIPKGK